MFIWKIQDPYDADNISALEDLWNIYDTTAITSLTSFVGI